MESFHNSRAGKLFFGKIRFIRQEPSAQLCILRLPLRPFPFNATGQSQSVLDLHINRNYLFQTVVSLDFPFGFEESYGYLTGSYVRDKDGVDGAYMICEMFSYYATKGISLLDKLDELYKTYGYCLNTLHSYEFDGSAGFAKMQNIMQVFRGDIKEFGGKKVIKLLDYAPGLDGLPKSNVLKFLLEDNCSIVVRPSGTEPKLKIYISVSAENKENAEKIEARIVEDAEKRLAC